MRRPSSFAKRVMEELFFCVLRPIFQVYYYQRTETSPCLLIFSKMLWPPPLKTLVPNLLLGSGKMPFQWYLHFSHACPNICLELVSAASQEAEQLRWCTLGDRDPAVRLVPLNIWCQPVFCKREENQEKVSVKNRGRQFPKTCDTAEDFMECFEHLFCSQALSFLYLINAAT